jgi:hypothetical protein
LKKPLNIYYSICYGIFIIIISLPLIYDVIGNKEIIQPLHGAYEQPKAINLSWETWVNQTYQQNKDSIYKYTTSLRPTLVRMYNEIDFRMFGKTNMGDLLVGKDNYLFSKSWAESRAGKVSLDSLKLDSFCEKLAQLENLLTENGIFFKFIIPPSKEEIFSDYLPEYIRNEGLINDYKLLIHYLKKHNVPYEDLTLKYAELLHEVEYPIYSKTSVHWTMYGAHFTLLSLLDQMNTFLEDDLIKLNVERIDTDYYKEYDGDQEKTLNLYMRIDNSTFAYPVYSLSTPSPHTLKPKVITIGDSFYWGIIGSWQLLNIFDSDSKYLYYYSTVFPNNDGSSYPIQELDMVEEFANANALIIINSSHNLIGFPYGFENDIDHIISFLENKKSNIP